MASHLVRIKDYPCTEQPENMAYQFEHELDNFQKHSIMSISNNENTLVTAHTGSGKTVVAIYAIADALRKNQKVIYCSPIKTLSNQKYNELKTIFSQNTIGLMTGDNKIMPNAECVVMTTEILRNSLYCTSSENYPIDNTLGCVIFDEIHYINDTDRGKVWEETLSMLRPEINLVMLSATIQNSFEFAVWISSLNNKVINLIPTSKRIISLSHYIYVPNELICVLDNEDNFNQKNYDLAEKKYSSALGKGFLNKTFMMNNMVEYLKNNNLFQTIFFSFSRKSCEKYAKSVTTNLITSSESAEISSTIDKYMHKYEKTYESLHQYSEIKRLMMNGVCYHHSGIVPIFKEIIEILFQKGLIKILFATETFAVGVNMPTKTVVFTELAKFSSETMNVRNLLTHEYKQMSGRAGRRGLDSFGTIIILPLHKLIEKNSLKQIMTGKLPIISSKFYLDYTFILKTISNKNQFTQSDGLSDTQPTTLIQTFLEKTLYAKKINALKLKCESEFEECKNKYKDFDFSPNEIDLFEKYISLTTKSSIPGITIKLSKKQVAERNKVKKDIFSGLENKFKLYKIKKDADEKIEVAGYNLHFATNFIGNTICGMLGLLGRYGYVNQSDNSITTKGVIASQINCCNSIILTEIITNGYLDNLSEVEIVGLMSIFIDEKMEDNYEPINSNVEPIISDIIDLVEEIIQFENDNQIKIEYPKYWSINLSFVNISMKWAEMKSLSDVVGGTMYVGNFVKSILQVNNIVKDIIFLCEMCGKNDIVPKLSRIESILVRDVVTVNSLYL